MSDEKSALRFPATAQADRAAGAWLARRDRGFTAAERAAFEAWLEASPRHAAAVAELERTMRRFDRLPELLPAAAFSPAPDPDALAPSAPPGWPRRRLDRFVATTALAAALAVLCWRAVPVPAASHYVTAPAQYDRAVLVDGSAIALNGDTRVDVEFSPTQRSVRLRQGEAHFEVAKDASRPFVVEAHGVTFRAVGTAFNVRVAASSVEMLVTEGTVQVESQRPDSRASAPSRDELPAIPPLTAGQKIVVHASQATPPLIAQATAAEREAALAWQPRVSQFSKTPLSRVVAEFNRRNALQLRIDDPDLNRVRIGGNFRIDEPQAFVRLLETSFGITAEQTEQVIVLRKAP